MWTTYSADHPQIKWCKHVAHMWHTEDGNPHVHFVHVCTYGWLNLSGILLFYRQDRRAKGWVGWAHSGGWDGVGGDKNSILKAIMMPIGTHIVVHATLVHYRDQSRLYRLMFSKFTCMHVSCALIIANGVMNLNQLWSEAYHCIQWSKFMYVL